MRAFVVGFVLLASAASALVGCPAALDDPGRFEGSSLSSRSCDAPAILSKHCASCHGGATAAGGVALDSPTALAELRGKASTSGAGLVIDIVTPERSVLYTKMTSPTTGSLMPPTGELEADETACVRAWLQSLVVDGTSPSPTAHDDRNRQRRNERKRGA